MHNSENTVEITHALPNYLSVSQDGPVTLLRLSRPTKRNALVALNRVHLSVPEGEFVGIVAPSVCGKPTLQLLVAGLETRSAGQLQIAPSLQRRPLPGMVYQIAALLAWLTVADNVGYALAAQGMKMEDLKKMDLPRLRAGQRDQAVQDVKSSLLLERVAELEKIEAGDDELNHEIEALAKQSKQTSEAVRARLTQDGGLDRIRNRIRSEKTLDFLYHQSA